MSSPNSRASLKEYCLRKLGKPVLQINIDDEQTEDCIDDALSIYQENHMDGVEETFLKHVITGSTLTLSSASTGTFSNSESITGGTSNCTAKVHVQANTTTITFYNHKDGNGYINNSSSDTFTAAETVTGSVSGSTGTVDSVTFGDIDNYYIPISDSIIGVKNIFHIDGDATTSNMFGFKYQFLLSELGNMAGGDLIHYAMSMKHMALMNDLLVTDIRYRYNRHMDKLYVDIEWKDQDAIQIGDFLIVNVYQILNPETYTDVYNDIWLKKYLVALMKKQWGQNLIKFEGMQLPGGTTLNGRQIYNDGMQDIELLEEELILKYQAPLEFFMG